MHVTETEKAATALCSDGSPKSSCSAADKFINNPEPAEIQARLRFQFLGRLHALGPKPLAHFLQELERGADFRQLLEIYADLPADLIRHYRGDQFAPSLRAVEGPRS
jgi:hypothetical protein